MQRGRQATVVMELLGLELVQRENDRKSLAPERDERPHERHIAEDPRLVLDEHGIALRRDEFELAVEIGRVEVLDPDEGDLVSAVAKTIGHGERVVVDAAALVARHDDDLLRLRIRQLPPALGERELQPVGDMRPRERLDAATALLDEVLPERLIVYDPVELRRDGIRRFRFEEDPAVTERLGYGCRRVGDDRQIAPHRLEEWYAEAFVLREGQERRRAAVVGDELLDRHAARERDGILEPEPADVTADAVEVAARHRRRTDQVEMGGPIGLAIFRERCHDIVDRLVGKDLAHGEDRGPLVR